MIFTLVFLTAIVALIVSKAKTIVLRNNLDTKSQERFLSTTILLVLFIVTNATLPYPQSLYWFFGLGVVFTSVFFSHKVLKTEFKRFLSLNLKDKIVDITFYSLVIIVTNIYL